MKKIILPLILLVQIFTLVACNSTAVESTAQNGNGATVDVQDLTGMTALANTALHGGKQLMEMLIQHNSDINKANMEGKSPLYISCEWGQFDTAALLANNHRVDINQVDNDCVSPLAIWGTLK